ncbi:MAG: lipopolysaccharide heptosyltransferase II [Candidatus Omnitrophota bacterium]
MKILFVTLSNIGDAILTLPVLDALRANYPDSEITCITGSRPKGIFENNPAFKKVIVYDKKIGFKATFDLVRQLSREKFDAVIDLRNSFFGVFVPAKYKISPFAFIPGKIKHMRDRHLYRLKSTGLKVCEHVSLRASVSERSNLLSLPIGQEDDNYVDKFLKDSGISNQDKIVIISAGARSHIKRWSGDGFLELISELVEDFGVKVILVGDKDDIPMAKYICPSPEIGVFNLTGKTTLKQLAALLKRATCVISNDSAIMHLSSYLNIPTVAIFGPTNEEKYGPWPDVHYVVKKNIFCRPCEQAQCRFFSLQCMQFIKVEDVLREVRKILETTDHRPQTTDHRNDLERILVVRTDRIGDVLLSTPVIKALRDRFSHAYIAMMVSPSAKDVVEGNPYLDEVIVYDKDGKHNSWARSLKFAHNLKKKRFDLAIILHPTNRVHLITFFARVPRRVGYNRKLPFLLTDRIEHSKQLGEKHELEYNLDLLDYLGVEAQNKNLFMPIREDSEKYIDNLFRMEGFKNTDKLLAIHPAASCVSKIWPEERFAEVARKLALKYGFKIVIVAGSKDMARAKNVAKIIGQPVSNFAGRISVSQLASLLKRCKLLISNDSGPVHIACAVGTPVISIFGRAQMGLSPKRWGPVGENAKILHKPVGCIECLAHNCVKDFACLKAITVEDVLSAADSIIDNSMEEKC